MRVEGERRFEAPRERVWELLTRPEDSRALVKVESR